MEEQIFTKDELENNISQAMLWLGYNNVEFNKRFSAKEFEQGKSGEDVMETEITYSDNSPLLPKNLAKEVAKIFEKVIDYHLKVRNVKLQIKAQKEKLIKQELATKTERDEN